MCGQPCSGKSEAAACLTAALRSSMADITVRVIDESSLHLGRNDSYKDMVVEKNLRGVLRSEVDRSVSPDSIIIVDSLNNIKVRTTEANSLYEMDKATQEVVSAIVEAQSGLGLAMNKISLGPNLPTISFTV
ncbi:hypothetical protein ACQ4PT_002257 [Festuca glaucescens]